MKKFFPFLLLILITGAAHAQTMDSTTKRFFFHSSVGLGTANADYDNIVGNGFVPETGIEFRFSRHSALAVDLSFATYKYTRSAAFYNLDNRLNITSFTLFYKYIFGNGRLRPYLRAGGGAAIVSVPTVTARGFVTDIRNEKQTVAQAQGEAGLQFAASRRFTFFAGAAYQGLFDADLLGTEDFRATVVKVGLITTL